MTKQQRTAKAGERIDPKAVAFMKKTWRHMEHVLVDEKSTTIQPKSDAKSGQWGCADCGQMFANNMEADGHATSRPKHRLAWWTGTQFEEP